MEAPPLLPPHGFLQIPSALLSHTFSFLPPNERTLTARFVCREAAAALPDAEARTASVSQPLPPHAVPWAVEAGQQHVRQLPFEHKLQVLSTAASSGSEVNLEVALAVLQPSVFQEMLITGHGVWSDSDVLSYPDPGVAAVAVGHPQLLRWLVRHCPALVWPENALEAAAEHCDLAGLQGVWRVLNGGEQPVDWGGRPRPVLGQSTLDAAARSLTPDAVAKMEWVLGGAEQGRCSLNNGAMKNAVRSGDLGRLRWLQERGCSLNDPGGYVLRNALECADMAMVQWLVEEAGCDPLGPQSEQWDGKYCDFLVADAAKGPDGLARVLWLQERGVVLKDGMGKLLEEVRQPGLDVTVGQAQTLRHVMQHHSDDLSAQQRAQVQRGLHCAAVASGSILLVEELLQSGVALDHQSYYDAVRTSSMDMTRWLVTKAKVSAKELQLWKLFDPPWLRGTPARNRALLEAVQLLMGAGAGARSSDVMQAMVCAAERGNVPLVQFLAQHLEQQLGCQPDWHRIAQAAGKGGCEALLDWLAGKAGCLANADVSYMPAIRTGDRATLTALRRLGVPWGAGFTVVRVVQKGCQLPVLRWLVEQGAPVGSEEERELAVAVANVERWVGAEAAAWLRGLAEAAEAEEDAAAAARRGKGRAKAGHNATGEGPTKPPRRSPRNHGR